MAVARKKVYTPKEYLKMEERSETRHEFINGDILDMSAEQSRITKLRSMSVMRSRRQFAKLNCLVVRMSTT